MASQLGSLCPVVPVTMVDETTAIYRSLVAYKHAPAPVARWHARRLSALLAMFWTGHAACAAPTGVDLVAPVPSATARGPRHPLVAVIEGVPALAAHHRRLLAPAALRLRRNLASPAAFVVVAPEVAGARVLLLDDTYTTGAHLQSAAATLVSAGAAVSAVTLGRRVPPPATGSPVRRPGRTEGWDPARCGRCTTARDATDRDASKSSEPVLP